MPVEKREVRLPPKPSLGRISSFTSEVSHRQNLAGLRPKGGCGAPTPPSIPPLRCIGSASLFLSREAPNEQIKESRRIHVHSHFGIGHKFIAQNRRCPGTRKRRRRTANGHIRVPLFLGSLFTL